MCGWFDEKGGGWYEGVVVSFSFAAHSEGRNPYTIRWDAEGELGAESEEVAFPESSICFHIDTPAARVRVTSDMLPEV